MGDMGDFTSGGANINVNDIFKMFAGAGGRSGGSGIFNSYYN
jgi:hypothetical protein